MRVGGGERAEKGRKGRKDEEMIVESQERDSVLDHDLLPNVYIGCCNRLFYLVSLLEKCRRCVEINPISKEPSTSERTRFGFRLSAFLFLSPPNKNF